MIDKLYEKINNLEYRGEVPTEAVQFAKDNGLVFIMGGSDDLMYAYGAKSYLTDYEEHSYGDDGNDLKDIGDERLKKEAAQLGLKIFWCGKILNRNEEIKEEIEGYDTDKQGAFSYTVNDNIESKDFIVLENEGEDEVYCTGLIIKLPDDFEASVEEED